MKGVLVFAVAAFGLAYIVGFSKLSLPVRSLIAPPAGTTADSASLKDVVRLALVTLLECPACFGFWVGLIYGFACHPKWAPDALGLALFTCGSNYLLAKFAGLLEESHE